MQFRPNNQCKAASRLNVQFASSAIFTLSNVIRNLNRALEEIRVRYVSLVKSLPKEEKGYIRRGVNVFRTAELVAELTKLKVCRRVLKRKGIFCLPRRMFSQTFQFVNEERCLRYSRTGVTVGATCLLRGNSNGSMNARLKRSARAR